MFPKKGLIALGADADFTIVDMKLEKKIRSDKMQTKGKESTIFDGTLVTGWPFLTIVGGNVVMKDGEIVGKAGNGEWVKPIPTNS